VSTIWLFATYWTAGSLSFYLVFTIVSDLLRGAALPLRSMLIPLLSVVVLFSVNFLLWRSSPISSQK
jgi:Na+-driven multidrug efflux pump